MGTTGNRMNGLMPRSYAEATRLLRNKRAGSVQINKSTAIIRRAPDRIAIHHDDADVVTWNVDGHIEINTGFDARQARLGRINAALPLGYAIARTIRGGCELALKHGEHVVGIFSGRIVFTAEPDESPPIHPPTPLAPPGREAA